MLSPPIIGACIISSNNATKTKTKIPLAFEQRLARFLHRFQLFRSNIAKTKTLRPAFGQCDFLFFS